MQLTLSQASALETILALVGAGQPLISLSGAAGTGKTTLIKELTACLDYDYAVCTPTNKAAQVLCDKGIPASTFYKKFYVLDEILGKKNLSFTSYKRWLEDGNPTKPDKLKFVEVLLIDEASMVSYRSVREMQKMCNCLILVGDHNQLPPVGDREFPAGYFGSLKHDATLTEVMRQAEGSQILGLAEALREDSPKVPSMLKRFEPEDSFRSLVTDGAQLLAFTNKERQRLNYISRKVLGFDKPYPQMGDRMVVTNNFSEELINGTVVEIVEFDWNGVSHVADVTLVLSDGTLFTPAMSMRPFINDQIASQRTLLEEQFVANDRDDNNYLEATFAYCLTAHKAQGSEWDSVVVFDQRGLIRRVAENDERSVLTPSEFVRRWTYTAITRARKNLYWAPSCFAQVNERNL